MQNETKEIDWKNIGTVLINNPWATNPAPGTVAMGNANGYNFAITQENIGDQQLWIGKIIDNERKWQPKIAIRELFTNPILDLRVDYANGSYTITLRTDGDPTPPSSPFQIDNETGS